MNISINSMKIFIVLNSFLIFLSLLQYSSLEYFLVDYAFNNIFYIFLIFISRNYLLLHFVNTMAKHKQNISNNILLPKEDYNYEFDIHVITSTTIETITHIFIHTNNTFIIHYTYIDLLYFIPISFLFEIIFDLFHYIGHRTLHSKYFYKYLHKKHHKFQHPIPIITFYQDPIDIIITNSLPIFLALSLIPKISYFQFNLIIIYKTYTEICGHLGKKCYPSSSFCQCIWLPKLLNIELYIEDHELHHSLNNCNYSKRFVLWDKIFGTFTPLKI